MSRLCKVIDNVFEYVVAAATGAHKSELEDKEAIVHAGIDYATSYGRGKLTGGVVAAVARDVWAEVNMLSVTSKELASSAAARDWGGVAGALGRWFVGLELLDFRCINAAALEALRRVERLTLYSDPREACAYADELEKAFHCASAAAAAVCAAAAGSGPFAVRKHGNSSNSGGGLSVVCAELQDAVHTLEVYAPQYVDAVRQDPLSGQGAGLTVTVCLERIAAAGATAYNERARLLAAADPRHGAYLAECARGPVCAALERAVVAFRMHADLLYASLGDWVASLRKGAATTEAVHVAYADSTTALRKDERRGTPITTYGELITRIAGDVNVVCDFVRRAAAEGIPASPVAQTVAAGCYRTLHDYAERMLGTIRTVVSGATDLRAKEAMYTTSLRLFYTVATEAADVLYTALFTTATPAAAGDPAGLLATCARLTTKSLDALLTGIGTKKSGTEEVKKALLTRADIAVQRYVAAAECLAGQCRLLKSTGSAEGDSLQCQTPVPPGSVAAEAAAQRAAASLGPLRSIAARITAAAKDANGNAGGLEGLDKELLRVTEAMVSPAGVAQGHCAAFRLAERYLTAVIRETPSISADNTSVHKKILLSHTVDLVAVCKSFITCCPGAKAVGERVHTFLALIKTFETSTSFPHDAETLLRTISKDAAALALAAPRAAVSPELAAEAFAFLEHEVRLTIKEAKEEKKESREMDQQEEGSEDREGASMTTQKITEHMNTIRKALKVLAMGDVSAEQTEKVTRVLYTAATDMLIECGAAVTSGPHNGVTNSVAYMAECGYRAVVVLRAVAVCYATDKTRHREGFVTVLSEVVSVLIAVFTSCHALGV